MHVNTNTKPHLLLFKLWLLHITQPSVFDARQHRSTAPHLLNLHDFLMLHIYLFVIDFFKDCPQVSFYSIFTLNEHLKDKG